ncbi:MAG: ribonuclease P protein component [Gammaproteobacteria bacterium RIFCSPHIGHO2_12_FULL_45_12]|nr:MAG: ribonuclease P protein component [Gammaproteobacteria bacterium RIFCSPHIGHO2_12_FULL_45_12]
MLRFSRQDRLIRQSDFQSVFAARPSKLAHHYLLVLSRPNGMSHARLGVNIAKRHVRRAVDRNKVKRILRESFRHHREALLERDFVVILRASCSSFDKKALREDINHLWQPFIHSSQSV